MFVHPVDTSTCNVIEKCDFLSVRKEDCFQPVIENGFIKQPNKGTVVFSCKSGFKLNTEGLEQESTCFEGLWSSTPKCIGECICVYLCVCVCWDRVCCLFFHLQINNIVQKIDEVTSCGR